MKIKQDVVIGLAVKLNANKDEIQKRLSDGLSVNKFAIELGTSPSTTRTLLTSLGFTFGNKAKRENRSKSDKETIDALLTVVHRIAATIKIPHEELKPFIE